MNSDIVTKDMNLKKYFSERFSAVRGFTEKICTPLEIEDYVIQSMIDVSPTKWHLAHTTWFFETFVLKKYDKTYKPLNEVYNYLFNSYYVQVGERFSRPHRGLLSRPTVKEVFEFRKYVDEKMNDLIYSTSDEQLGRDACGI